MNDVSSIIMSRSEVVCVVASRLTYLMDGAAIAMSDIEN